MRLTFAPDDDVDVRLGVDVASLRPLAVAATGRPELAHLVWWVGSRQLTPEQRTGVSPLVDGAVVVALPGGTEPGVPDGADALIGAATSPWHLAVVAGPATGWLVGPTNGRALIGSAASRRLAGLPALVAEVSASSRNRWHLRRRSASPTFGRPEPRMAIHRRRRTGWRRVRRRRIRPGTRIRVGRVVVELRTRPTGRAEQPRSGATSPPTWLLGIGTTLAMAVALRNPVFLALGLLTGLVFAGQFLRDRRRAAAVNGPSPAPAPADPAGLAAAVAAGVDWSDPPWRVEASTHYGAGAAGRSRLHAQVGLHLAAALRDGAHPICTVYCGADPPTWVRWLPRAGGPDHVVILLDPNPAQLAAAARLAGRPGVVVHSAGAQAPSWCTRARPDLPAVGADWVEAIGRLSAGAATANRLPARVALAECWPEAALLLDRTYPDAVGWLRSAWSASDCRLATVIGLGLDGPFELDLARDGPHGIVAGTTGAGKSALLRTLLLGLAIRCSPADLAIVAVDFKGGTSLGCTDRLPHVVGRVDDTDPRSAARAIAGLRSELTSRATLLSRHDATDIADLLRSAQRRSDGRRVLADGTPCPPRLLVVVDEFRAVTEELPDFIPDLVRLAAQGRSLGVHVLLATQRPTGAVSADIRANMSLRIGLRMLTETDSLDLLGRPDAASIDAATPGRAIVATDRVAPVQIASADVPPSPVLSLPGTAPPRPDPDLEARVVGLVAEAGAPLRLAPLWAPVLPAVVTLADLDRVPREATGLIVGLVDDVPARRWRGLEWDPADGGLLVTGRSAAAALGGIGLAGARAGWAVHVIGPPGLADSVPPGNRGTAADLHDPARIVRLVRRLGTRKPEAGDLVLVADVEATANEMERLAHQAADAFDELLAQARHRQLAVAAAAPSSRVSGLLGRSFTMRIDLDDDGGILDRRLRRLGTGAAPRHGWLTQSRTEPCAILGDEPGAACPSPVAPLRIKPPPEHVASLPHAPTGFFAVGLGGDDANLVTLPFRSVLVVGPPSSGRSTVLESLAAQARTLGRSLLRWSERSGGATGVGPPAPHPDAVLVVDDLDGLDSARADPVAQHLASGGVILASARTDRAAADYRGPVAALRGLGNGIVLLPTTPGSEHVFNVPIWVARDPVRERRPGYAAVISGRTVTGVVLAQPAGSAEP